MRIACLCCLGGLLLATSAAAGEPQQPLSAEQVRFFESRIRPVLAENCFTCHGPQKQKGGLRLDSGEALHTGGENGPVVKPGDPDSSRLIQAVRRSGALQMPPKQPLKPEAVEALTAWVKMGAPWPLSAAGAVTAEAWRRHWAFQPVGNPTLPTVKNREWPQTSVDHFIGAKLEEKGLAPSPAAERRTLLRRLTFDLIGLPPTPDEIAAFEADPSRDAFARVVDRLLASPHYGERWGRHWLDVARYADTKGYVFFEDASFPWAWTYRDYVIRAFNEDLPYDRFVCEQLAADRLDVGADRRPLTALGFLTLGGRFMNNPHDILDDRIDVVTRGLMGLTVTCARCHDHKFDPVPTRDYYSLYGIFASSIEPTVPPLFADPPKTPAYQAFEKELQARELKLQEFLRAKRAEVFDGAKSRAAEYLLAAHARRKQPTTDEFMLLADGKDLNPKMLERWQAYLDRTHKRHHTVFAPWHAFAELPEREFAEKARLLAVWLAAEHGPRGRINRLVAQSCASRPPKNMAEVAQRYGELLNGADRAWQKAGASPRALPDADQEELRQVFHGPDAPPNVSPQLFADLDLLPDRPAQAKLQELRKAVEDWRANGPAAPPRAMVLVDSTRPVEPRVFRRGNPNNPGEAVPRQFLEVLAGKDRRPFPDGGRLELARAITDPKNPLTARVLVNRIWLHHFGAGLVRTPSDFGLRGEPPSHPELLDHLATRFRASGWSIKQLHRLIVLSATYQQASDDRAECQKVDPENLLLWKMNRRRLDLEATRDALLAVSGRLNQAVGGPSVKDSLSAAANRRTLYGHLDRLNVPGLLRTFDFPSPDASSPQRSETTVPQQALFLMNNPFVQECARGLCQRPEIARDNNLDRKIDALHGLLYGRGATSDEIVLGRMFLTEIGAAAWERYAQALLMANEFAFVD